MINADKGCDADSDTVLANSDSDLDSGDNRRKIVSLVPCVIQTEDGHSDDSKILS